MPHLETCWMQGRYAPTTPHVATWWYWFEKKMELCASAWTSRLNVHTKKDSYLLPWIQEMLESMVGITHFSTMDFKTGFWQVKMAPESQQYTAFTVGNLGFYQFNCMPSGLCNAPATFQCLMQNMLGELNLTYCVIYLDDVIVFGHTEEEHLEHLCIMFEQFHEFNLKSEPSTLVKKMCMQWRSSQCQKPSPKSSLMYWGRKLKWAQCSCHPRHGKW